MMIDYDNACAWILPCAANTNIANNEDEFPLLHILCTAISEDIRDHVVALGSELELEIAEAILECRKYVRLIVVKIPLEKQVWDRHQNKRYRKIIRKADECYEMCGMPSHRVRHTTNEWLINHVDVVIPINTGNNEAYNIVYDDALERGKGIIGHLRY